MFLLTLKFFLELPVCFDLGFDDVKVRSDGLRARVFLFCFAQPVCEIFELELLQFHEVLVQSGTEEGGHIVPPSLQIRFNR